MDRVAKKQFKDDQAAATAFVEGAINRISGSTDVLETAKNTDLVIEAIVEKLEVKQKLFASIDAVSRKVQIENAKFTKMDKNFFAFRSQSLRPSSPATPLPSRLPKLPKAPNAWTDSADFTSSIQCR